MNAMDAAFDLSGSSSDDNNDDDDDFVSQPRSVSPTSPAAPVAFLDSDSEEDFVNESETTIRGSAGAPTDDTALQSLSTTPHDETRLSLDLSNEGLAAELASPSFFDDSAGRDSDDEANYDDDDFEAMSPTADYSQTREQYKAQTELDRSAGKRNVRFSFDDEVMDITPRGSRFSMAYDKADAGAGDLAPAMRPHEQQQQQDQEQEAATALGSIAPELVAPELQLSPRRLDGRRTSEQQATLEQEWDNLGQPEPWELVGAGNSQLPGGLLDLSQQGPDVRVTQSFTVDQMRQMRQTALAPTLEIAVSVEFCETENLRRMGVDARDVEPFESNSSYSVVADSTTGLPPSAADSPDGISSIPMRMASSATREEDDHDDVATHSGVQLSSLLPTDSVALRAELEKAKTESAAVLAVRDAEIGELTAQLAAAAAATKAVAAAAATAGRADTAESLRLAAALEQSEQAVAKLTEEQSTAVLTHREALAALQTQLEDSNSALAASAAGGSLSAGSGANPPDVILLSQHVEAKMEAENELEAALERYETLEQAQMDTMTRADQAEALAKVLAAEAQAKVLVAEAAAAAAAAVAGTSEALTLELEEMTDRYATASEKAATRDQQLDEANVEIAVLEQKLEEAARELLAVREQTAATTGPAANPPASARMEQAGPRESQLDRRAHALLATAKHLRQRQQQILGLFREADADHDGLLTRGELATKYGTERAEKLMEMGDANHDGVLDLAEFSAVTGARIPE